MIACIIGAFFIFTLVCFWGFWNRKEPIKEDEKSKVEVKRLKDKGEIVRNHVNSSTKQLFWFKDISSFEFFAYGDDYRKGFDVLTTDGFEVSCDKILRVKSIAFLGTDYYENWYSGELRYMNDKNNYLRPFRHTHLVPQKEVQYPENYYPESREYEEQININDQELFNKFLLTVDDKNEWKRVHNASRKNKKNG